MSEASNVLRKVLQIDAVTSLVSGLVMFLASSALSAPLGLSADFLRGAGLSLLPFAAFVAYTAKEREPSRAQVWTIVLINAVWVVDSALVLLLRWQAPTLLGYAVVVAQAAAVAVLMELEIVGLRRTAAPLVGVSPSA